MRELTDEEALLISGGAREGAPQVATRSQSLLGPAFGVHRGISGLFQPTQELDVRTGIDSMIMES